MSTDGATAVLSVAAGICLQSKTNISREAVLVAMLQSKNHTWGKTVTDDSAFNDELSCLNNALKAAGVSDLSGFSLAVTKRCNFTLPDKPAKIQTLTDENTKTPKAIIASMTIMVVEAPVFAAWTKAVGLAGPSGRVGVTVLASHLLEDAGEPFSAICSEFGTTAEKVRDCLNQGQVIETAEKVRDCPNQGQVIENPKLGFIQRLLKKIV